MDKIKVRRTRFSVRNTLLKSFILPCPGFPPYGFNKKTIFFCIHDGASAIPLISTVGA